MFLSKKKEIIEFSKIALFIFVYRLIIDYCYFDILVPNHGIDDKYIDFRNFKFFLTSLAALFFTMPFISFMTLSFFNWTTFTVLIMYTIIFVPFTSLVYAGMFNNSFITSFVFYWIVILLATIFASRHEFDLKTSKTFFDLHPNIKEYIVLIFFALELIFILYIWIRYADGNITLDIFSTSVYEQRLKARDFPMSTFTKYLFSSTKYVIPVFLAYYLSIKRYFFVFLIIIISFISYGIDCSKGGLFLVFFTIFFFLLIKKSMLKNLYNVLFLSVLSFSLLGVLEYIFFHSRYIVCIFIRRAEFLVVKIMSEYYDFFQTNEIDLYRSTVLRHLGFVVPYPDGISRTIGKTYYLPQTSANSGLFSDGYANFGFWGLIIMPIMLVFVIKVIDIATEGLDARLIIVTLFQFAMLSMNGFLITNLIINGYLFIILILFILPRNSNKLNNNFILK